jgi:uncharacterized protein YfdQ (DUF2303 family)
MSDHIGDDSIKRDIVQLAKARTPEPFKGADGREYVVLHDMIGDGGVRQVLHPLTDQTTMYAAPARIQAHPKITSKGSFGDYVRQFSEPGARIYADLAGGKFVAVLDHAFNASTPSRNLHQATFALQLSEEWKRWSEIDKKLMPQADFARWLEENMADISVPAGADILEIVRDMSAVRKVDFSSAVRLQNGDTAFEYVEETKAASKTGQLELPTMFVLMIPVWYGEPAVEQRAFLRWRLEGQLQLGIELHRPAYVKQAVFEAISRDIAERTERPVTFGTPG